MNETTKQLKGFYRLEIFSRMEKWQYRLWFKVLNYFDANKAIEFLGKNATLKEVSVAENIFTNAGKAQMALLAGDATAVPFTYVAVGTSNTAVAATDTTLTAEIVDTGLSRAAGTVTRITTTVTNDTYQISKTFTATGSKTIEEVGIFNASSAGTMLSHALTGSKALTNNDTLAITYTLKFA